MRQWRFFLGLLSAVTIILLLVWGANAFSTGFVGLSGNPATTDGDTCSGCHSGGVPPEVVLSGPTTVVAGTTAEITFTIQSSTAVAAGFNVSASDGTLAKLSGAVDVVERVEQIYTRRIELTHAEPKDIDAQQTAEFRFLWTAPSQAGSVRLYGAGNAVDGMGDMRGDGVSATQLAIEVIAAPRQLVYLPVMLGAGGALAGD